MAVGEREALKDDVTNKEGQIVLLRSQLEIVDRKLRLTDMENSMLKSELDILRRQVASVVSSPAGRSAAPHHDERALPQAPNGKS